MSTVPSGVLPLTASGPSSMFPAHPARYRTQAVASAMYVRNDVLVGGFIRRLLLCSPSASDRGPIVAPPVGFPSQVARRHDPWPDGESVRSYAVPRWPPIGRAPRKGN